MLTHRGRAGVAAYEATRGLAVADSDGSANRRTAYEQVCTSFHAIDDLRTKLLGFLPLVTGGGLILLTGRTGDVRKAFFGPFGIFGILITFGLLVYELNGMKRCQELIYDGEALERAMGLTHGQFTTRVKQPSNLYTRPFAPSNMFTKPFAAAWIYPAVIAAWTYLGLVLYWPVLARVLSPIVLVAGLVGVMRYDQSWTEKLRDAYERTKSQQEIDARPDQVGEEPAKPAPPPPTLGGTPPQ
jgi:hypothetical protein